MEVESEWDTARAAEGGEASAEKEYLAIAVEFFYISPNCGVSLVGKLLCHRAQRQGCVSPHPVAAVMWYPRHVVR